MEVYSYQCVAPAQIALVHLLIIELILGDLRPISLLDNLGECKLEIISHCLVIMFY